MFKKSPPTRLLLLGKYGMLSQAVIKVALKESFDLEVISKTDGFDLTKIRNNNDLEGKFEELKPDLVFNASGITDLNFCEKYPEQAWMLHSRVPALIAAWSNKFNKPWVHVSTDHYYRETANNYHNENHSVSPLNEYAASKLAGEHLALTSKKALVLRTNIIGKRGWESRPNFVEWVINSLKSNNSFEGYTNTWTSSIEVEQFASLALKMVTSGANGLMNLACSESLSKAEWIEKIALLAGLGVQKMKKVETPTVSPHYLQRANAMGLDCSKSQAYLKNLGLILPDSNQVVEAIIESFRGEI